MPFVVKAEFAVGPEKWLTVPRLKGVRAFADRDMADVFESQEKAATAIGEMMLSGSSQGAAFTVEETDDSRQTQ
jgi:hypothetical protein